jgi:hypothetical protein
MSNEEQGIFQAQARAAGGQPDGKHGLRDLQQRSGVYLDERIVDYLLAAASVAAFEQSAAARSKTAERKP